MNEKRETLFEDRTHCHADHVDHGYSRDTTAAVGVLKAVKFGDERCVCVCVVCVCVCMCTQWILSVVPKLGVDVVGMVAVHW